MKLLRPRASGANFRGERRPRYEELELRRLFYAAQPDADLDLSAHHHTCGCSGCMVPIADAPFYAGGTAAAASIAGSLATASLSSLPALNSLVGAAATLYLDFNGHFESVWGGYQNITTPVFDTDGDLSTFSQSELTAIQNIWGQVAEDFAPFNINVSTVQPASFANGVSLRVSIGGDGLWMGNLYGGVAYVDSFTNSIVNTAYVFSDNLGGGYAKYVAEAVSHEAGHAFGLQHQSTYDAGGNKIEEYSEGNGQVAPIMGVSYNATRGVWTNGPSSYGANVYQDNMATIARAANGFGYRSDDHGNATGTATALGVQGTAVSGGGVVTQTSDTDYFSFTTGAGSVSLSVQVLAGMNNLDARLELRNAAGNLVVSAQPTNSFGATITTTLSAGTYFVAVRSEGNYGDVGQYTVSGQIVAPAPQPQFDLQAISRGSNRINLSWQDAVSDETGYTIQRSRDGVTWSDVTVTAAGVTSYADRSVWAGRQYYYRVQSLGSADGPHQSDVASAITRTRAPVGIAATALSGSEIHVTWQNVTGEAEYLVKARAPGRSWRTVGNVGADVTGYTIGNRAAGTTYEIRVAAVNDGGIAYSAAVSASTPSLAAAPTDLVGYRVARTAVELTWNDQANNEWGYNVYRARSVSDWTLIAQVAANSTSVRDYDAGAKSSYSYRVQAYNAAGDSAYSNHVTVGRAGSAPYGPPAGMSFAQIVERQSLVAADFDRSEFVLAAAELNLGDGAGDAVSRTDELVKAMPSLTAFTPAAETLADSNLTLSAIGGDRVELESLPDRALRKSARTMVLTGPTPSAIDEVLADDGWSFAGSLTDLRLTDIAC